MRKSRLLAWVAAGIAGALVITWVYPQAFPFIPETWTINKEEATALALERLRDLGEHSPDGAPRPVADPYVVTHLESDSLVERRLQQAVPAVDLDRVVGSPLADAVLFWEVVVYPPKAGPAEWTYRARVSPAGSITALQMRLPPEVAVPPLSAPAARERADRFLVEQGFDLADLGEPEVRTQQRRARTDTTLRYRYRQQILGDGLPYGVEVSFAGDRLTGLERWIEDPDEAAMRAAIQPTVALNLVRIMAVFVALPIVAVPFLRRYHEGEVGVKRGLQLMALVFVAGTVLMAMTARPGTEGFHFGVLTRAQTTWVWFLQMVILFYLPFSILALLSWSVGESYCRKRGERWSRKLAAFDALFQRRWGTDTVARSALRGAVAGILLVAASLAAARALRPLGAWPLVSFNLGPWYPDATWAGLVLLAFCVVFALTGELFGRLFLLPLAVRRLGPWLGGGLIALATGLLLWGPGLYVLPLRWSLVFSLGAAAVLVILFLAYDFLTVAIASAMAMALAGIFPFLSSEDPWLQFQGWLALIGIGLPLLVSLRHLGSGREFVYRYEDVPPHVRRIAERERQKIELETARRIQSSILPELPPQVSGVQIAHAYLPASEVGGDFYDLLALEDGRLAIAVGDVAGHGVSSGLVMSMAKSALAVQVTFDPAVEAVFGTLNRLVFQSARKRLLATLCYALLDPRRRELFYASAGHLFPYRVSAAGKVHALESVSYPLGVRRELPVRVRAERLDPGDTLILFSDGVIEARREGSDDLYGFARLEAALARLAGGSPEAVRDGILAELQAFTAEAPREDDVTLLVLRV
jgi:hypothetical protein